MTTPVKLGYWGIRGRAQIARLLLDYTGANWEDVVYADPAKWFGQDKVNLGLDFPNLPYLIDGDFKLSESSAIHRYIIERSGNKELLGKNAQDAARVNEIISLFDEIRSNLGKLLFDKDYESKLKQSWQKVKPKFDYFQKFVGNKEWIIGYLTLADFEVSEISHYFQNLYPQEFKSYPSLKRIRDSIDNLPQVKEYYGKQNAIKGPFLPPAYAVVKF